MTIEDDAAIVPQQDAAADAGAIVQEALEPLPAEHARYKTIDTCPLKINVDHKIVEHLEHISGDNSKSREDTVLILCLLGITVSTTSVKTYSGKMNPASGIGGKQSKTSSSQSETYRRLFVFADGESKGGRIVVVFEKTLEDQQKFWKYAAEPTVGDWFAMIEPSSKSKFLGPKTSVATTSNPLCPLKMMTPLPVVKYNMAEKATSRYFILNAAKMTIDAATIVPTNCTGAMCDRRNVDQQGNCGCYHKSRNAGRCHVVQMDMTITHEELPAEGLTITDWSSLNFTNQLFTAPLPGDINLASLCLKKAYRKKIKAFAEYVNENGGVTLTAWHRLGVTRDATVSGADDTQVVAEKATLHFERSTPTVVTRDTLKTNNLLFQVDLFSQA
jgi:hypothetical protein